MPSPLSPEVPYAFPATKKQRIYGPDFAVTVLIN